MKKICTLLLIISGITANAQNMISNGFGFMAAINGTTYQKTSNVGSTNYQFVAASSNGQYFYAANFNSSKIYIINSSTYVFVDSFTGPTAYYITAYNEPNMLFARGYKSLLRYNPSTKSLTDSLLIGNPWFVEERPGAKEVWVTGDSLIYVVNYTTSLSLTGTIKTTNNQYDNADVRFTPKGSIAYKSAPSKKKVYKIDANTRNVIDSINTAPYAFQSVLVSADSSSLYACLDNKIYIIDATSKLFTDSSMISNKLIMRLYRHPSRNEIWAIHHFNDSVTVYNASTKTAVASFGIGPSPFYLAFAIGTTGINKENEQNYSLQLYPNPANQMITVSMSAGNKHDIQIYNNVGQQVGTYSTTANKLSIDISTFAAGKYYMSVIENNDLKKTVSFMKE